MKQFLYLYPIKEYFDSEFERRWLPEDDGKEFRQRYSQTLNRCIDVRYRQNGFRISYAVFDGSPIDRIIELRDDDRVIEVGMDFETHTTELPDKTYPYPNQDFILNQLETLQVLRVAGFHMWDCVEKLARRAHERGLDVLVDEDLTEFFPMMLRHSGFRVDRFPSYNPRDRGESIFEGFIEARKGKPWLWQEY